MSSVDELEEVGIFITTMANLTLGCVWYVYKDKDVNGQSM